MAWPSPRRGQLSRPPWPHVYPWPILCCTPMSTHGTPHQEAGAGATVCDRGQGEHPRSPIQPPAPPPVHSFDQSSPAHSGPRPPRPTRGPTSTRVHTNPRARQPAGPPAHGPAKPCAHQSAGPAASGPANPRARPPVDPRTRGSANPRTRQPAGLLCVRRATSAPVDTLVRCGVI